MGTRGAYGFHKNGKEGENMREETLRANLIEYKKTFGTSFSWMAKQFGVDRSLLSGFVNKCREINLATFEKIENGYNQLPKRI